MKHRVTEPLVGGARPPQLLAKAVLPQVRSDAQHLAQQSSQQLCVPTQHFPRFKRSLLANHMPFKQKVVLGTEMLAWSTISKAT